MKIEIYEETYDYHVEFYVNGYMIGYLACKEYLRLDAEAIFYNDEGFEIGHFYYEEFKEMDNIDQLEEK